MQTAELTVEGYSTSNPVPDEDWEDVVRWEVNYQWQERAGDHNRDGWFAQDAGSTECLALGHTPNAVDPESDYDVDPWEDVDDHVRGWGGDWLCEATKWQEGNVCTECESEDCPIILRTPDTDAFWKLFAPKEPAL